MSGKPWTEDERQIVRERCAARVPYAEIGAEIGRSKPAVEWEAYKLGCYYYVREECRPQNFRVDWTRPIIDEPYPQPAIPPEPDDWSDNRSPMPPGWPISWGAITRGTVLEGQPYPNGREG